jgi:hypothetical protein
MVRHRLLVARSKVRAVRDSLASRTQTLEQAAAALEIEARIWGQDLHHAILEKAALEGLPPERFENRAVDSAVEIVGMAADEFSVRCGRDTVNGVTPVLIGRLPAVITSEQPPKIDTRGSIVEYLKKALADYPPEYRRQNLSVYKLTRGVESVSAEQSGEQEASSAERPDMRPTLASTQTRVPLNAELKEAESRTANPKLRNRLVAVLRYNRYFEDLKVLKTACQRYQTPALLAQNFQNLDVWAVMNDDDKADIAKGEFQPGIFAWSLVKRMIGLRGDNNRTLKNYRKALRAAGLL